MNQRSGAALVIGLGQYQRAEIPALALASRDAEAVADLLADADVVGLPDKAVVLLTDAAARRDAIVDRLNRWLPGQAEQQELVFIYFAGHGVVHRVGEREEGFLLPYDGDPENVAETAVAMSDVGRWLDQVSARAVVLCLDCCHAGHALHRSAALRSTPRDLRVQPGLLTAVAGKGRYVLASCDEGQTSLELGELGHGLFTHHLLKGLQGAGDRDGDGKVGVAELFEYITEAVERDAREKHQHEQKPWIHAIGAGGVYLSTARRRPVSRLPAEVREAERLWGDEGVAAALEHLENRLPGAAAEAQAGYARLLGKIGDPRAAPLLFRCLAHPEEAVRQQAHKAIQALGWPAVVTACEALARAGDGERLRVVFGGLRVYTASIEVVRLLERLVHLCQEPLRQQAVGLLEYKQLGLEFEQVAGLFQRLNAPYQLRSRLGQGLFAAAYLARHTSGELDVVVRVLRPQFAGQPGVAAQFIDLARRAMKWQHQHLVVTTDVGAHPEHQIYYAVRRHVEGRTLQQALEKGRRFTAGEALNLLRQLVEAVAWLHRQGHVHGSIKPGNIFLCREAEEVVLGDPSLPLDNLPGNLPRLRYDLRYAAPEQFDGQPRPASDLYALGMVAYEVCCGQPPFQAPKLFALQRQHEQEPVPRPSAHGSVLGKTGDAFLLHLLAKDPEDRPAASRDLLRALDELEDRMQQKLPETPEHPDTGLREPEPDLRSLVDFAGPVIGTIAPGTGLSLSPAPEGTGVFSLPGQANEAPGPVDTVHPSGPGSHPSEPQIPHRLALPGYEILNKLGEGGMGVVYMARQLALNRLVALKMIRAGGFASSSERERFRTEAEAIARLQHPNIVQVHAVGEHEGIPFFSLEFCPGGSLQQKLKGSPLPFREAAQLVETLARAMQAAHEKGILHRDLKPANVLLGEDGTPKITDFGLAKKLDAADVTASGAIMGTPSYMAPEQAAGKIREIGPSADVYSLGALLYECLTGRPPFKADSALETLDQVRAVEPVPPSRLQPRLPRDLETICLKCLRKESARRYARAADLAEDLHRFLADQPIKARPVGALKRALLWGRRNPTMVALLVMSLAFTILLVLFLLHG